MNIKPQGHTEEEIVTPQKAVSLTPDILRILEETREGAMEELDNVGDYREDGEVILETENFKVEAVSWENTTYSNGIILRINPERDIWMMLGGKFQGEQFFTQEAAKRELKKVGKRLPTEEEWKKIILDCDPSVLMKNMWQSNSWVVAKLKLEKYGLYVAEKEELLSFRNFGGFWMDEIGSAFKLNGSEIMPISEENPLNGLSVRCVKDSPKKEEAKQKKSRGGRFICEA